jgi:hypothetical protein
MLPNPHNITQQRGPPQYKNGILGAKFESKSPQAAFSASHYYILRAHKMRAKHLAMLYTQ